MFVVLAAALSALLVGSALAARPKAGKSYSGTVARMVFNGFKAPISFTVSKNGKQLLGFKYAAGDCGGMGGPGNPWTNAAFVRKIATIKVDSKGNFSIKNAKWKVTQPGTNPPLIKTSYSTISGRFKTAKKASGTITAKVTIGSNACQTQKLSFTATTK